MEDNPLIKIKRVGVTEEFFRLQTFRAKLVAAGHSPEAIAAFLLRLRTEYKITTEKGTTYEIMIMEEKPPKRRKISKPCEACDGTGRTKIVFADCPYCNGTGIEANPAKRPQNQ